MQHYFLALLLTARIPKPVAAFGCFAERYPFCRLRRMARRDAALLSVCVARNTCTDHAWIDAQDFQILRLRTDLLAPLPELNLKRVTSTIEYTQIHIPELGEPLWLPQEVELLWQTNGQETGEIHRYSKYRLFRATIKLRP
jgi:hypothetical protein